jgi:hypothetical protein
MKGRMIKMMKKKTMKMITMRRKYLMQRMKNLMM